MNSNIVNFAIRTARHGEATAHYYRLLRDNQELKRRLGEMREGAVHSDPAAEFAARPDLQAEFGTEENYVAFKKAESAGLVKIFGGKMIRG